MTTTSAPRPRRKPPRRYHHGDLPRALLHEAVRTIQRQGVEGLTLRSVAQALGVSRTAMYRHFVDKSALLAAVAREGFRTLRLELLAARAQLREDPAAMGVAYVRFATTNPSYYRVMFGGLVERCAKDAELEAEASGAFEVLVEALVAQQQAGRLRQDEPRQLARFIWAILHGIARLAIDGQLQGPDEDAERLTRYALGRVRTGIAAPTPQSVA